MFFPISPTGYYPRLVSCNCLDPSSLYLMNNKYFAVFLPSLGIDETLFHLGELIMKIYAVLFTCW